MFLTVTPNLCVERTFLIPDFSPGKVHRIAPDSMHVNAGGKGINAARVAAQLGSEVLALTWAGKAQCEWFEAQLAREGVAHELIAVEADTRICLNILNGDGLKTEIVEAGAPLQADDRQPMLERFDALLPDCELAAICGSYPPPKSTPEATKPVESHLTQMAQLARRHGKKLIVDSKGAPFEQLLQSEYLPWAIKPNTDEAAALLKRSIDTEVDERRAVDGLIALGISVVLLSCGGRGAYLGTPDGIWFFTPPSIKELSPVGSGDTFVGAFAAQYLKSNDVLEAVRWGVAAGAANASQLLSAFCTRTEVEELLTRVQMARC